MLRYASWKEALCYTSPLIADLGQFYDEVKVNYSQNRAFALHFEWIVQACNRTLFRGTSVRFGWPIEPKWPKPVNARIGRLATAFGLQPDDLTGKRLGSNLSTVGNEAVAELGTRTVATRDFAGSNPVRLLKNILWILTLFLN